MTQNMMGKNNNEPSGGFDAQYPHIADWVTGGGWIEIGPNGGMTSFVRALIDNDLLWEGEEHYATLEAALQALEDGIAQSLNGDD